MIISSLAVDDFHPAANAITRVAKSLDYEVVEHNGHKYKGVGTGYEPEQAADLISTVFGQKAKIDLEFFRLGIGNDVTNYIHADSCESDWAAVWYLTEAPKGVVAGTALWRHKETGLEETPDAKWLTDNNMTAEHLSEILIRDNQDESKWEMVGLIGQKYNRIAFYKTKKFHSRFPKDAWGSSVKDGRVCWVSFFHLE